MGRVRTKTVKKAARVIVEKYYGKLTLDFQVNKKITEEVATIPSKRLRNKIAGFTTHLMKRIQKGALAMVTGVEEERERRMEFVPDRSEVNTDFIQVDADTRDMLKAAAPWEMEMDRLPNISTSNSTLTGMSMSALAPAQRTGTSKVSGEVEGHHGGAVWRLGKARVGPAAASAGATGGDCTFSTNNSQSRSAMGRVRTKTVKKAARVIVEKYYGKLTLDFQVNKKITEEVATIPSKRLRNKIAGFTTHLMKRIQKGALAMVTGMVQGIDNLNMLCRYQSGRSRNQFSRPLANPRGPVRGISLKLQEEERERRMEFVPDRSEVNTDYIQVDSDTRDMLKDAFEMEMDRLPNISISNTTLTGRCVSLGA
eukprot:Skav220797  [mRNA]  locus=scaffold150:325358:333250:+ [translate_table: standard]